MKRHNSDSNPDWDRIESGGGRGEASPLFTPDPDEHKHMLEVLSRKARDGERKRLVKQLGEAFSALYVRYRLQVQSDYALHSKEMKYAREAATLCVMKGVTPRQLIEHWHEHVNDFTGMQFPSLHFLASPGNVDRVAAEVAVASTPKKRKRSGGSSGDAPRVHAYSDPADLDPRIRKGLTHAGFDLTGFSDRHLLTVQSVARAKAKGQDMFVSSKLRAIVQWVVENVYAE